MSGLYGKTHRDFQDRHATRRLADRLEEMSHETFDEADRAFIESAAMFFLSTVDERGRPTVSYKGGAPGFVKIFGPADLVFPVYDGNGMFLSLGNIAANPQVGLLFIDFEHPRRLRVQGAARIFREAEWLAAYPGATYVVGVQAERIFVNCGRYIHKADGTTLSRHVPDASGGQPFPTWKRIEIFGDCLSGAENDALRRAGGPIAFDAYRGEDDAPSS
ncbi:MAG TPA: pyridoxamine 5'-phosphate oxidase family protein [Methylovirgula sp.]|nr:pyridoxamine 5'-phosphate oxidase family protein [Methylovirgula sp.]